LIDLRPAPLAVYLHWPYCARICPYCDFAVVRDRGRKAEKAALVEAMAADLTAQAGLLGPRSLVSVFLGGGTPSLMDPADVADLIVLARALWPPEPGVEVETTLEANPTDAEAERFAGFRAAGVDRLSLGVQALDDESLRFLGRNHGADEARRAARLAADLYPRLSLDLIYALPGQTPDAWARTLDEAVALGPEHLSPYQLTIEAGTPFERQVRRGAWAPPDPDLAADLYERTQAALEGHGYQAYEVSNHARGEAARSRHNLAYWRGWDYVGAGPGAHGRLTLDGVRTAVAAPRKLDDYLFVVEQTGRGWSEGEPLDPVQVAEERLLMGLRTLEGVGWGELAPLSLTPATRRVKELAEDGLIAVTADRLVATAAGRLLLDRVTAKLAG
jgi:oxygen-independent coproporphyrinogen-3 oxidase